MNGLPSALIGHTGFVGSNLASGMLFDRMFNSQNIEQIRDGDFSMVVCAGVSAVKWQANRQPDEDWRRISSLMDHLATIQARKFVLISTIDVYRTPLEVYEDTPADEVELHAYGRHRLALERWVAERFPGSCILRLPALFGAGLKKNIVYDLIHGNMLEAINPASSFQWYPLRRLPGDLSRIVRSELDLVNIACAPIMTGDLIERFFPNSQVGEKTSPAPSYDVRTRHAAVLGGSSDYHLSRDDILSEFVSFMERVGR